MNNPPTDYTATLAERTVRVDWPSNERGGATPPGEDWQERAWAQEPTLHEIDEGSISGCSVLRWREDPRTDAELVAVSLALVTGKPAPAAVPAGLVAVPPTTTDRDRVAEALAEKFTAPGFGNTLTIKDRVDRPLIRWTDGQPPQWGLTTPNAVADALADLLPAGSEDTTTTRADTLLGVADWLRGLRTTGTTASVQDIEQELRRLAAETQPEAEAAAEPEWARPETEEEKLAKARRMAKALSAPPVAPPEWDATEEWPLRHKRAGDRRVHATAPFQVNAHQEIWTACGKHVGKGGYPLCHMPVDCRECRDATTAAASAAPPQPEDPS